MGIDLSKLSPPIIPGLLLDPSEITAAIVNHLQEQGMAVTANASDPAYRVLLAFAQREANIRQQIYDSVLGLSLAYAIGDELNLIGQTYYGVLRLQTESDDSYRQRIADTPERFAIGLSGGWYEGNARAVTGVLSAKATSPTPGVVKVYIQADKSLVDQDGQVLYADGVPSTALIAAVLEALTAADVRQQTDEVQVLPGNPARYTLTVQLAVEAEPDSALVLSDSRQRLMAVLESRQRLGETVSKTIIAGAVFVAGVRDAQIELVDESGTAVDSIATEVTHYPIGQSVTVEIWNG